MNQTRYFWNSFCSRLCTGGKYSCFCQICVTSSWRHQKCDFSKNTLANVRLSWNLVGWCSITSELTIWSDVIGWFFINFWIFKLADILTFTHFFCTTQSQVGLKLCRCKDTYKKWCVVQWRVDDVIIGAMTSSSMLFL